MTTTERNSHEQTAFNESDYTKFIVDSLAKGTQPVYDSTQAGQYAPLLDILLEDYNPDDLDEFTFVLDALKNKHKAFKDILEKEEKQTRSPYPEPSEIALEKVREYYQENEYGDALLFAEAFEGRVCYDHTAKKWYLWTGHYWKKDTTGHIRILIAGKLGYLYLKAAADLNTPLVVLQERIDTETLKAADPLKDAYKQMQAEMQQFRARAKDLRGAKRMNSVSTFVQSLMGVTSGQWDSNPWVIGTEDGVINLQTGLFRDGDPSDYIRTIIPTRWTGLNTPCPRFEQFQREIFEGNEERDKIIAFKQRLLGYGITGLTIEAIFPILYGEEGRNGKDTELGAYKDVLGRLVGAVSNDVFVSNDKFKTGGAATPHICDLQGKRLVWGSETKQNDKLNIAQLKLLTGGGEISARQNYGEQFSFLPTHKLLLMTNYKPHADANDKAFWSRACLIEYKTRFVSDPKAPNERQADPYLKEALRQEASGILAWLVRGCLAWQREGLNIPETIRLATKKYRDEEDNVLQFVEDRCVREPGAKAKASPLYSTYKAWCKDQGSLTMNNKQFSSAMEKIEGIEKKRGIQAIEYHGVRLIPTDDGLFTENMG